MAQEKLGQVIDLFNNEKTNNNFFNQFTTIQEVNFRNNRIFIQIGVMPLPLKQKVLMPPEEWIKKLKIDIWDPINRYQSRAFFEKGKLQTQNIILLSQKLTPPIARHLKFSDKTLILFHGPDGQSIQASMKNVDQRKNV